MNDWKDCERCERHAARVATIHRTWAGHVQVVLVVASASIATQAAQRVAPSLVDAALQIEKELGLPRGSVEVDHLAACGLGRYLGADHVAACVGRFREQVAPRLLVLVGEETRRLAEAARLIRGNRWEPWGTPWSADVAFADALDDALVDVVSAALARPRVTASGGNRSQATSQAQRLYDLLGANLGHRRKQPRAGAWRTWRSHQLTLSLVERHLAGKIVVSPFHPQGMWRFVVIDVDRHNAIQAKSFDDTMTALCREFPNGIVLQSSLSGGQHIYVRVSDNTTYEEAALLVRFHLAGLGLLWLDTDGSRSVRSIRVEVPTQPPRLPFGEGSCFPGDARPIDLQVADFCQRLESSSTTDFDRVRAAARAALGTVLAGKWSVVKVRRLEKRIAELEVAALPAPAFEPGDPRGLVAPRLPAYLRKVMAHGIPAYGTRTRWTIAMAKHLGEFMSPEQAAETIEHWLRLPSHVSADIQDEPERVVEEARRMAKREARANGVPKRIWARVDKLVQQAHADIVDPARRRALEVRRYRILTSQQPPSLEALRLTAFQILRRFYNGRWRRPVRCRSISHRQFGQFAGDKLAHSVEMILTNIDPRYGGWLAMSGRAAVGRHSRRYRLEDCAWPVRPYEPRVYQP